MPIACQWTSLAPCPPVRPLRRVALSEPDYRFLRLEPMRIPRGTDQVYPSRRTIATAILTVFIGFSSVGAAAAADGEVRGEVLDDSGGLIPGVTVAATIGHGRVLATTVTDSV